MRSMTGFGRAEGPVGTGYYAFEIKSVNGRYLDIRFRAPSSMSLFEIPLGDFLRQSCERGSFEINVKLKLPSGTATVQSHTRFVVDETALTTLMDAVEKVAVRYKTPKIPSLEFLVQTNRVFIAMEDSEQNAGVWNQCKDIFSKALTQLVQMRETEGKRLQTAMQQSLDQLSAFTEKMTESASEQPKLIRAKLDQRIAQWQLTAPVDAQRLEWEVAFYADRASIQEELDRLRSHIEEFAKLMKNSAKSVGRRLDFLTQEMHREVNTVHSKTSQLSLGRSALDAKVAIEKLREQVQNVE